MVARIRGRGGRAEPAIRRAAFENTGLTGPVATLVRKVAEQPSRVTDADVAAVQTAGLNEDQIFEIVVCAAVGQSTRQYHAGLAALEAATGRSDHGDPDESESTPTPNASGRT